MEATLAWLHTLEFNLGNRHAWPWHRWRDCTLAQRDAFMALATPALAGSTVLDAALALRLPEKAATTIKPVSLTDAIATGPHCAFETCMKAFAETRFQQVEKLAAHLMQEMASGQTGLFKHAPEHRPAAYSFLLEIWWFAVYRQGMAGYVRDPQTLHTRLTRGFESWSQKAPHPLAASTCALLCANHAAMQDKMDDALPLYAQAETVDGFRAPVMPQALVTFSPEYITAEAGHWYAGHSTIKHHFTHAPESRHALLVSCDTNYLHKYAELFAALVAKRSPDLLLHIHLINGTADDIALLARISADHGININHSLETNGLLEAAPYRRADITSTARYVYLPDYLNHYAGVTVSDIDGWTDASAHDLSNFDDKDILVSSWIWRKNSGFWRLPWSNVSAGLLSVRVSGSGKAFAAAVSRYIQQAIHISEQQATSSYFADQAALFLCLRDMTERNAIRTGFLTGGFRQSGDNSFYGRHAAKRAAMENQLRP